MISRKSRMPKVFIERIRKMIDDADAFESASVRQAFRLNTLKADERTLERMKSYAEIEPVPWYENGFFVNDYTRLGNTLEHFLGKIYVQDASSMIPPTLVDENAKLIVDMCAAPGSKATQIAQDRESATVIANDINIHRLKALQSNISRLGCLNVVTTNYDAKNFPNVEADAVILDAPCSSDGMLFRDEHFFSKWSLKKVRAFSRLQKVLIERAYDILRPGGELIYSTCTSSREENEEVVEHLLDARDAELERIDLPFRRGLGLDECVRVWPQDYGTETFFVAKIRKVS